MSDTENKTENKTEKIEAAPYMKKTTTGRNPVSNKSNFVIPMVLLLVSAIVIVATFYEDEYNALLAQPDVMTDNAQTEEQASTTQPTAKLEAATETTTANSTTQTATQGEIEGETKAAPVTTSTVAEGSAKAASETAVTTKTAPVISAAINTATPAASQKASKQLVAIPTQTGQTGTAYVRTSQLQPNAQYYHRYNREQSNARAKHMAMLQQRRQAYEQEMQSRRARYEAAMKAQQEKRHHIMEAQKAAYQRTHQKQMETKQKLQKLYQKIGQLHQEIDQVMREYYSTQPSATPSPMHTM